MRRVFFFCTKKKLKVENSGCCKGAFKRSTFNYYSLSLLSLIQLCKDDSAGAGRIRVNLEYSPQNKLQYSAEKYDSIYNINIVYYFTYCFLYTFKQNATLKCYPLLSSRTTMKLKVRKLNISCEHYKKKILFQTWNFFPR